MWSAPICRSQVRNEDFYNGRHTHNDPVTPPVTPSGGGNTGGSGEPVVGSYHPDNNGTTSIGNPPYLPQEIHATVKGEVLFKKNLPAKTLTQRAKMDCVSTSSGIVYSLMGSDKTAEEVRSEIEKLYKRETGEMLHAVGVRGSNNLNNLLENPKLNFEKINPTDILSSINDNMPIVAILDALNGSDKHMVVIVGYYDDWNTEAFQCINPGTGKYETHYSNEFYIKDIDGKNTITTYIYRKNIRITMKTLFLSFFMCISSLCVAQVSVCISQLNGTKWQMIDPVFEEEEVILSFSPSFMIDRDNYPKDDYVFELKFKYYLSNSVPIVFEDSLVGKESKGSFLVYYNHRQNKVSYYQIMTFTSDKLVLFVKGTPNSVGGGEDVYFTYKRLR